MEQSSQLPFNVLEIIYKISTELYESELNPETTAKIKTQAWSSDSFSQNKTAGTTDTEHSNHMYGEVIELRMVRSSAFWLPTAQRTSRM